MKFRGPALLAARFKSLLAGNPLKPVSLAGLMLGLILGWAFIFFSLSRNEGIFPGKPEENFIRDLQKYDTALAQETPEQLEKRLDRLEKQAGLQDERLSVLKRRRFLAERDLQFFEAYQKSAREAAETFPQSEVMAAVAGEALAQGPLDGEKANQLRKYAELLARERFLPLELCFYALAGSLETPESAMEIPGGEGLLQTKFTEEIHSELEEQLGIDALLLAALEGDRPDIGVRINGLVQAHPESREYLRLGGEFFYDFGNPLAAAEMFYRMGSDYAARTADALALAGEISGARNIWTALANSPETSGQETRSRSLYNLAATAQDEKEAAAWLEKIFTPGINNSDAQIYALIRFSRLANTPRSIAILEEAGLKEPLLDLELLRRQSETLPQDRISAETWLLLGRHPESEALYQWGAWYFDRQKQYSETAQVLKIAGQRRIEAPWINLRRALACIRDNEIDKGYEILETEYRNNPLPDWRLPANMARVEEERRAISKALALYETAADLAQLAGDRSLLQLRLYRCYESLGRFDEGQNALKLALELDPDNLTARMEVWRLNR